jgi:predicted amidohydrolase
VSDVGARARIRATVVQNAPRLGDVAGNLAAVIAHLERAAGEHCDLVVFPECALSGYMFSDERAARSCAEPVPGPSTDAVVQACARHGLHCALGLLELDGARLHNTAVLIGPDGLIGRYRKSHIACIGADQFTVPGEEPYVVHATPIGRIGLQICYDWRFPEITRVLALGGAEVVVHPTNSPAPARELAEFITRARAAENAVFFLTANRCGEEQGTSFFGWSQIVDPVGRRLAEAGEAPTTISAVLDLDLARAKTKEPNHGGYQVSLFGDRRPELYAPLAQPHFCQANNGRRSIV